MDPSKEYCPICGMKVEKKQALYRFGRYFCSEDHVEVYSDRIQCGCGGA
jgi:YHS domain-containing protein